MYVWLLDKVKYFFNKLKNIVTSVKRKIKQLKLQQKKRLFGQV